MSYPAGARSLTPDFAALDIAMDAWSEPFWQAVGEHRLQFPRCGACGTFRWPAGPFCYKCRSQDVAWEAAGQARIFSYTVLPVMGADKDAPPQWRAPVVVEFEGIADVRLVSVLVDAPLDQVAIGGALAPHWLLAANASVPAFRLKGG
jgi:uncharacterized OB-fold protein